MTVLILAQDHDRTADHVVRALQDMEAQVARFDLSWFPQQLDLDAELRDGQWVGQLRTAHRVVDLHAIRSIWYRSPATFALPAGMSGPERGHAHREAKVGVGGVLSSLPVLWVNHPARAADAVYKPAQLVAAASCGLHVPRTLVSNCPATARRFAAGSEDGVVLKMLASSTVHEDSLRKIGFTRRLGAADLADLSGFDVTCHQVQEWVPKRLEARVVVMGQEVFTVGIHAASPAAHVDWRSDHRSVSYDVLDPPADILTGVRRFMALMGLVYGALDFVIGPDGTWTFLEVNPGGQFGWLQMHTHLPMTEALAGLLAEGAT